MPQRSILASGLMFVAAACSSTTEPRKAYENVELEIIWSRADDASLVGEYAVSWVSVETHGSIRNEDWGFTTEAETVATGQIPRGQDTWIVRFHHRCGRGYVLGVGGYYEGLGPEARCLVWQSVSPACVAERQTVVVQGTGFPVPEAGDGCEPRG